LKQTSYFRHSKSDEENDEEKKDHRNRIVIHGHEMFEKEVKKSGNSGRIYLPPSWIGKRVKIIRTD
jgi:putative transposon-encoded protein